MLDDMGSLSALSATATAWTERVGVPVSGQVQAAEAGLLTVDDNWDGDAANAYRQMLPLQKAALEKVKTTITDGLSTALDQLHGGIFLFWTGLAGALVALADALLAWLGATAWLSYHDGGFTAAQAAPFAVMGASAVAGVMLTLLAVVALLRGHHGLARATGTLTCLRLGAVTVALAVVTLLLGVAGMFSLLGIVLDAGDAIGGFVVTGAATRRTRDG
ncbi:hypothetical protein Acy02nite_70350 [Actinoplanes cyaneus]|uniref:Uncharacterized protein n=1 Tax=Actinoplanes cyaneus TaxID=52696 RepID=A0A919MB16_9ACTN|nr:hypothetical protein [Actinoplanes cyaneus]MCW2140901.1 hypothetical protein [Actinoplanes cyaneus]GID69154.1 hypothetical protein Acy02nite_70350 [Actinoplanes cyaneus]